MKTLLAILTLGISIGFTGCESLRITGAIQTSYGSISSDGKTVNLSADTRGWAK